MQSHQIRWCKSQTFLLQVTSRMSMECALPVSHWNRLAKTANRKPRQRGAQRQGAMELSRDLAAVSIPWVKRGWGWACPPPIPPQVSGSLSNPALAFSLTGRTTFQEFFSTGERQAEEWQHQAGETEKTMRVISSYQGKV